MGVVDRRAGLAVCVAKLDLLLLRAAIDAARGSNSYSVLLVWG